MATSGRSEALEQLQQQLVAFVLEEAGRGLANDPDAPLSTALIEAVRREVELKVAALARPDADTFADEVLAALRDPIAAAVVGAIQATPIELRLEGDGVARRSQAGEGEDADDRPGLPAALMRLRRSDQALLAGLTVLLLAVGGAVGWTAHRPKAQAGPPAETVSPSPGGQAATPAPETPIADKPPTAGGSGAATAPTAQGNRPANRPQSRPARTPATGASRPASPPPPPAAPSAAGSGGSQPQTSGGGG